MRKFALSFVLLCTSIFVYCQNPSLVKDLTPGLTGSAIQQIVATSQYTFFTADDDDADTNRGLFRTDGTQAGTIKLNLNYQTLLSTKAEFLTLLGNKVVFVGENRNGYYEIWSSDGTQAGTIALERFQPGNGARLAAWSLAAMGNYVYYGVVTDDLHIQLKRTDGTAAGTSVVKDFGLSTGRSFGLALLTVFNGALYFDFYMPDGSDNVWKSDGTEAGTQLVKSIPIDGGITSNFMQAGDNFYFFVGTIGASTMWKSDGTTAGTTSLKTIGTVSNINLYPPFINIGSTLYFAGNDNVNGKELWRTDGSIEGTVMVSDINPGAASSNPVSLTVLNNILYYSAESVGLGRELYRTTPTNTALVRDIYPGMGSSNVSNIVVSNNLLLFAADNGATGIELWMSDGLNGNTKQVADLNPDFGSAAPSLLTARNNIVYFSANNGVTGAELFQYNNAGGLATGPTFERIYVNDKSTSGDVLTSATGNDLNPGTPEAPVATISHALSIAQPGYTIIVDAGTYTEQVNIDKQIIIKGAGKTLTFLNGPSTPLAALPDFGEKGIIQSLSGAGNVHIEGISVDGSLSDEAHAILIQGGGNVISCELKNSNNGIFFRDRGAESAYANASNNSIHHISYVGINYAGSALNAFGFNNSIDLSNANFGIGIIAGFDFGFLSQFLFQGNTIIGHNGWGIHAYTKSGSVSNNSITGSAGFALRGSGYSATCNWYGTYNSAEVRAKVDGNIGYMPYLITGTDAQPSVIGFQPLSGACTGPQPNYYVNDNSSAGDVYTTAVGNDNNSGSADMPFATITKAISVAANGSTIYVDAGTYAENVVVDKSVMLKGAQAGVNPGSLLTRGSESIIVPAMSDFTNGICFAIRTTDISIDGFTLDGDNPALFGGTSLNNADVNAGLGVSNQQNIVNGFTLQNNIIRNFNRYGVFLQRSNILSITENNIITQNHLDNISNANGRAIALFNNAYASVSKNKLTRAGVGIIFANHNTLGNIPIVITGNEIESYINGIHVQMPNGPSVTISSNSITTADLGSWNSPNSTTANNGSGIFVSTTSNGFLQLKDNIISNKRDGISSFSSQFAEGITINGGSISNSTGVGAFLVYGSSIALSNLTLQDNVVGIDASCDQLPALGLSFSNVAINGGKTGIRFYGNKLSLPGNALTGIRFSNQSSEYILQTKHAFEGQTIDVSNAMFDGISPLNMTLAQLFATEDKLTHKIDFDGVGYFKLKPKQVFLTKNSFAATMPAVFGTATFTPQISRAIGAADPGDTVFVGEGTYTGQVTIDKAISLKGEGIGKTIVARGENTDLIPLQGSNDPAIIQSTSGIGDVFIDDLTIDGSNGTTTRYGSNCAIMLQTGGGIRNNEIKNMQIQGAGSMEGNGIYVLYNDVTPKTILVTGNKINGIQWVGLNLQGEHLSADIQNNEIDIAGQNYGMVAFAGGGSGKPLGSLNFHNNELKQYTGFGLSVNATDATINGNSFGGSAKAILQTGPAVTATCNWFGVTAAHLIADKLSGDITFTPWLTSGTDNDPAIGFQPATNACNGTPPVINLEQLTDVTCNGAANGTITTNISGGSAPYTFSWLMNENADFIGSTKNLSGLAPGTYSLLVTDAFGSTATLHDVYINEPQILTASAAGTNNVCYGGIIGTIDVLPSGGTAPYTYLWNSGATIDHLQNLAAGTYSVSVTDANGCTTSASYIVTEPTQMVATISDISTACSNKATVTVTGGTGTYAYLWTNGVTANSIVNVPAGTYTLSVTDENGCTITASIALTGKEAFNPSASSVDVSCFGGRTGSITITNVNGTAPFLYSVNGGQTQISNTFGGLAAGTYTVTVIDANGCTGFITKTIAEPPALTVALNNVLQTCANQSSGAISITAGGGAGAYTFGWSGPNGFVSAKEDPAGLAVGDYTLTVTDKNGCTIQLPVAVTAYNNINLVETVKNISCKGELNGSIDLTVSGGTGSGFNYSWTNGAASADVTGLGVGNYTVNTTDIGSGCMTSKTFTITQPASIVSLATTKTNATGCGGSMGTIFATGSGGTSPYEYRLNNDGYQANGNFTNLAGGNYTVWARDANGCTVSKLVTITDNGSDQYESNNSKNAAKPIVIGETINARIALSTDIADWFRFTTPSGTAGGGQYRISITHPDMDYNLQVFAAGNNTPALVPANIIGTMREYILTGGTTYYISITGGLSYTCYTFSVQAPFITGTSNRVQAPTIVAPTAFMPPSTASAFVYPNPHRGTFTLQVSSPAEGLALIQLIAANGQKIEYRQVRVKVGDNKVMFTSNHQGIIFYRVTLGNHEMTGKIAGLQ